MQCSVVSLLLNESEIQLNETVILELISGN